jgi:hypothetical protein
MANKSIFSAFVSINILNCLPCLLFVSKRFTEYQIEAFFFFFGDDTGVWTQVFTLARLCITWATPPILAQKPFYCMVKSLVSLLKPVSYRAGRVAQVKPVSYMLCSPFSLWQGVSCQKPQWEWFQDTASHSQCPLPCFVFVFVFLLCQNCFLLYRVSGQKGRMSLGL